MPRAGLSSERLAEAGAELADEDGFEAVTVAALARRFGVQPASLYSHVRSTDDVRIRVARLALDELADRISDAVAGRSGADALAAFAHAQREYAVAHPGRYAALKHPVGDDSDAIAAGTRHAVLARAVLRGYDLPEPARTHAIRMVGSTIRGFLDLEAAGAFAHSRPSATASWKQTVGVLDGVLRDWPA